MLALRVDSMILSIFSHLNVTMTLFCPNGLTTLNSCLSRCLFIRKLTPTLDYLTKNYQQLSEVMVCLVFTLKPDAIIDLEAKFLVTPSLSFEAFQLQTCGKKYLAELLYRNCPKGLTASAFSEYLHLSNPSPLMGFWSLLY